jgi:hypothetical protein
VPSLQQNRFSVVIKKLLLALGKRPHANDVVRRYSHQVQRGGMRYRGDDQ